MIALLVAALCGAALAMAILCAWGSTGDRRQRVAQLEAEERLRQVHLAGLQELATAGETALAANRREQRAAGLDVVDARIVSENRPRPGGTKWRAGLRGPS